MKRVFLVAGESSGDLHGANLIRALHQLDGGATCEGLGGERMKAAGMQLREDLASHGIMGLIEVLKSFGYIRRVFRETVHHFRESPPDVLVLIDYPGFNMRLAREAKSLGIPVVYYISPQVWAWKKGRAKVLGELTEKVLVILPFEEAIYRNLGVDCVYVGHPLLDHLQTLELIGEFAHPCLIGLLPGSREQEIQRILPVMVDVARGIKETHPDARFAAPCVDEPRAEQIRNVIGDFPVEVAKGKNYEVLDAARFCMVASGTATLETALFGVPMAVLYKVLPTTYWLARRLVDIDYIAMVNILAKKEIVPEFIQDAARPDVILPTALKLIEDSPARASMISALEAVRESLGGPGASRRAAEEILSVLETGNRGG